MKGGKPSRDHRKLAAGIACGAILLVALAAGGHWHRAARAGVPSPLETTLASSARAPHPSFTLAPPPLAIAHVSKLAPAPESSASALRPAAAPAPTNSPISRARAEKIYASLPLAFEANQGQTDPRVKFLSRGAGYTVFLTRDEAVLSLPTRASRAKTSPRTNHPISEATPAAHHSETKTAGNAPNFRTARARPRPDVVTMRLVGADPAAEITGLDVQKGVTNYFIGSDPKNWHTRVPNYTRVKYANVYPGVDQVYYGNHSQLESDFIVAPGADPSAITLEIRGARRMRLDAQGSLVLSTRSGEMRLLKPALYQPASGATNGRTEIKGSFVLRGPTRVGFAPGPYDRTRPLVIDPVMSFFSYFAGGGNDVIRAVALDQQGNMYVTGQTTSDNPDPLAFPPDEVGKGCYNNLDCAAGDVFVFKISIPQTPGNSPQLAYFNFFYVQIIGSTVPPNGDIGNGIAVDSQGNAYVAGTTTSGDFAVVNPCQGCNPSDSFVAELDPNGNIIFSTTFAGIGSRITGIALDSASPPHIFVGGTLTGDALTPNTSTGFTPTANALQQSGPAQSSGLTTGFVAELGTGTSCPSSAVDCLLYATFFGGTQGAPGDFINGIAVDSQGLVYITGTTSTSDFPVNSNIAGYSQTTCLTTEYCTLAFLAKLDPTAGAKGLLYSTTLGLPNTTGPTAQAQYIGNAVAVAKDGSGYAYITGTTGNQLNGPTNNNSGLFFPTTSGAVGSSNKSCTALSGGAGSCPGSFVTEINTNASGSSSLAASTYLGGVNGVLTSANAIAVDAAGNAFVAGGTNSLDFPLPNVPISSTAIQNGLPSSVGGKGPLQSIFLAVLPAGLSSISYSTYLGGSGLAYPVTVGNINYLGGGSESASDFANAIALDSSGDAYIAGQETSGNFYIAPGAGIYSVSPGVTTSGTYHGWAEIIGTGIAPPAEYPIVSLTPSGVNFGNVGLSGSGSAQITVTDTGTAALDVSSIAIVPDSGTPAGTFTESDNCQGRSVGISASCVINLTFTPGATGTTYGATLELTDNAASGTQTARLTGAGVTPFPVVTLTLIQNGAYSTSFNNTVQFGTIQQGGSGSPVTIQVQNSGTATLVMGSLSVVAFGGNASDISTSGDTCSGVTIPVFNSCQINLTFAPTSTPGTVDTLALVIPDNAPDTPQGVVLLGTSGTPPAPPTALPVLASVNDEVPPVPANGANIVHSAVSSGGQYVAFESAAGNLPGPQTSTGGIKSIYLRTICLQETGCIPTTNFISYGPTSGPNANGGAPCNLNTAYIGSAGPAIDSTGQFVTFISDACIPRGATPYTQIYLRNVAGQSTSLISLDDSGNPLNNGMSGYSMSADARYFAYSSSSANVAGLTGNFISQVFLRDANCAPPASTCTPTTLISQEPNGNPAPATGSAGLDSMSPDGRYVVFSSSDQNMAAVPPTSFTADAQVIYLRDTCNPVAGITAVGCKPTTTAISVDSTGNAVSGEGAAVANGGRFIIFASFACSLLPGGCTTSSPEEVYLADTCTYYGVPVPFCTTAPPKLISKNQNGYPDIFLSATTGPPSISADGRLAIFTSYSPLLPNVSAQAIYAYDTCTSNGVPVTTTCTSGLHVVSVDSSGTAFGNGSDFASVDATGQFVSFGTGGDLVTPQDPTPMSGGVYLGLTSGFAGSTGPALQITPSVIDFGNVLPLATSPTQTFTVTNSSPLSTVTGLTVLPAALTNGFAFVTTGPSSNACQTGMQLLPQQSCITQVDFTPQSLGQKISSIAYSATSVGSQTVGLTGWGGESAIVFEDMNGNQISSINFGNVGVGTTATLQARIANTGTTPAGTAPLDFLLFTVTDPLFGVDLSQCPSNLSSLTSQEFPNLLAPGASCPVTLSFTPTGLGPAGGFATFVDNAQASDISITPGSGGITSQALPLSGTAIVNQAHLILTAVPSPNPAIVSNPLTYQLTLTNAGPATAQGITLNLSALMQAPQGMFTSIASSQFTCSPPPTTSDYASCSLNSLAANASASITFIVTPLEAISNYTATFFLNETTVDPNPSYDTVNSSVVVLATAPPTINVTEMITVTDTPTFPDIVDAETITVTDQVTVMALPLTTTTLTSSIPNANQYTSITFTAQVSTASGNPTGTVTFFDGETQLTCPTCSPNPAPLVTVAGTTTATYTTSSLSVGVHLLTAVYSGDSNFSGSLSFPPLVETISVPADFSLLATPPSLIIQQGQSGTTTITITPLGNYRGPVSLSCPTLPSFASCTFTLLSTSTVVTSVTLDGTDTVVVELTINTTGPNGLLGVSGRPAVWWDLQNMRPGRMPPMLPAAALWLMGILALAVRQKHDKKLLGPLLLTVVLAGLGMLAACGFSPVRRATNSSVTPTGQSTAVVSVSGSTTHILDLTVTITPAP